MSKGFTLWFTGLSGAGKSTLATYVVEKLREAGYRKIEVLDGDVVRTNLSKGLGFSKEDRDINIRRIAFVCHLLTRNDAIAVSAAISPYRAIRDEARAMIGNFVEVFVDCPIDECMKRDVKGLYKKALAGEIKQFTGVSDPYEAPVSPEVVCCTAQETIEQSGERILHKLRQLGYVDVLPPLRPEQAADYAPREAEVIEQRLKQLGYL